MADEAARLASGLMHRGGGSPFQKKGGKEKEDKGGKELKKGVRQ